MDHLSPPARISDTATYFRAGGDTATSKTEGDRVVGMAKSVVVLVRSLSRTIANI